MQILKNGVIRSINRKVMECACCNKEFKLPCTMKEYPYKINGKFYCCHKCYSKVFDSKYKASSVGSKVRIGYKTDKTLR